MLYVLVLCGVMCCCVLCVVCVWVLVWVCVVVVCVVCVVCCVCCVCGGSTLPEVSLRRAGMEQLYQVQRMIGGIRNVLL